MKDLLKNLLRENLNMHDIGGMLNEIQPDCDCCKYFDMDSIQNYGGLVNPIYYMINKREEQELVYIPPKQYLYRIANGFGISYEDAMGYAYNDEKGIKYAEMMKNGSKAPIGYYVVDKPDQEGRHRAAAAMKLDCKIIPVVEINKNLNNDYVRNMVLELKGLSREQVDEIYKKKGYNGITSLDWRELQNYIEYRL